MLLPEGLDALVFAREPFPIFRRRQIGADDNARRCPASGARCQGQRINSAPLGSAIGPRVEPADSITLVGVTMTNLVARDFKFV